MILTIVGIGLFLYLSVRALIGVRVLWCLTALVGGGAGGGRNLRWRGSFKRETPIRFKLSKYLWLRVGSFKVSSACW